MTKEMMWTAVAWLGGLVALVLAVLAPEAAFPGAVSTAVALLILLPVVHVAAEALTARRLRRHSQAATDGS